VRGDGKEAVRLTPGGHYTDTVKFTLVGVGRVVGSGAHAADGARAACTAVALRAPHGNAPPSTSNPIRP
jgi:hypothetical protein